MKRNKISQRDPFGRGQSTFEEKEDDGSGPFDSRTGLLKDGRSVRVSMMTRDAIPPPSPGALVMYDVSGTRLSRAPRRWWSMHSAAPRG